MDAEIKNKLWQSEIKILDEIDRICKKHNINYFLMWGTLIGAVRHKGFIPWDDDIDIGMARDDYKKFLKVAKKELCEEYFLHTGLTDKNYELYFAKVRLKNTVFYEENICPTYKNKGIFVDIFPFDFRSKVDSRSRKLRTAFSERLRKYLHLKSRNAKLGKLKIFNLFPKKLVVRLRDFTMQGKGEYLDSLNRRFEKSDFLPTINAKFENKEYPIPRLYDKVLTRLYGNYMELPPIEQRVTHSPKFISFDITKDYEKYQDFLDNMK